MIKKILKFLTIVFIIFGIIFSISNLLPKKIEAFGPRGAWVLEPDGTWKCVGDGNDCDRFSIGTGTTHYTGSSKKIEVVEKQQAIQKETIDLDVKLIERIEFSQQEIPVNTWAFCVTEDGIFIIPDYEEGNIKIYITKKNILTLVNVIGRKGYGSVEMVNPAYCFYNNHDSKFGVMDYGSRGILIYDRVGRFDLRQVNRINCLELGYDILLIGDRLLISGFTHDEKGELYDLYYIDINNNKKGVLLPSYYKYGLGSIKEYISEYRIKSNITSIGIKSYFDTQGDDIYFAWEGDLKVIKLDIKKVIHTRFGKKTANYKKPNATDILKRGRLERNVDITFKEKANMSYVRNIFTSKDYVLVIYEGPNKQEVGSNFRVQFYTLDGDFLNEMPIPGSPDKRMCFDKDKHVLYSLCSTNGKSPGYHILKYKINFSIKQG